jgi:putative GTP pyrophosphokinase
MSIDGDVSGQSAVLFSPDQVREIQTQLQRFMLEYEFGLREIETKIEILRDEFRHMHDYNPIEHVSSRVKSADSIVAKVVRRGIAPEGTELELALIREHITDVAGVRVTCSFVHDAYRLFDLLTQQEDVTIRVVKDYIAEPKPNGYRSLHAVVEIPVFLSTGSIGIPVEIQFRTIAMDFWASLEHKIFYKYDGNVPPGLLAQLKDAAEVADALDGRMERLHRELHGPQV